MAQQDMHDDPQQLELLRVARIGRAQGLKGEVTVRLYTDDPEWRFEPDSVLYSQDGETEYIVEGSRTFKDRWILKLEGVDDRNAAEAQTVSNSTARSTMRRTCSRPTNGIPRILLALRPV